MIRSIDGKLYGTYGRLVVVDRCALLQDVRRFLPPDAEVVVADIYVHEAVDSPRRGEHSGFNRWAAKHRDRIWTSCVWRELSDIEASSGTVASPESIIHLERTRKLRGAAESETLDWASIELPPEVLAKPRQFVELCADCSRDAPAEAPNWRQELADAGGLLEWVRHHVQIGSMVQNLDPRFAAKEWTDEIERFPDRLAACRMARLIIWYALMHMEGKTRDFENNWADLEYAFTASYVGSLATQDKRLIETMHALFPDCTIYTGDAER